MAPAFRDARFGIERLAAHGRVARHRHRTGYAAIVLAGGYEEAGDSGRWRVGPGDLLVHGDFEAHQDCVGPAGCTLVNVALPAGTATGLYRLADPDAFVQLAERDGRAAFAQLVSQVQGAVAPLDDWPDRLARRLRQDDAFSIGAWAAETGLAAETVSRGFRRAYGVSPRRYRLEARARRALAMIRAGQSGLAAIAQECGFADQAHLSRTLSAMTGATPGRWRAEVKSVQ